MASDREIITVQLGSASNFVGAHWWNVQESSFIFDRAVAEKDETRLNHDVLFREGKNINNKITYTPRLVAIDFNDNVGRTNLSRNLYPEFSANQKRGETFGLSASVITQTTRPKNQFLSDLEAEEKSMEESERKDAGARVEERWYQLDDVVSMWTDFLRVPFHPKSLLTCESLNTYGGMSRYDAGESLCKNGKLMDEFENRLRFFAEDSNCLQGFHLLCDIHDGMAGISSEIAQYIYDEYPRNVIMAVPIFPSDLALEAAIDQDQYVWNTANGMAALASHCTVVVPLSTAGKLWRRPVAKRNLGLLNYMADLPYHTSAILASALETVTTPWRRRSNFDLLPHVCDLLTFDKRKIASISVAVPLGVRELGTLYEYLKEDGVPISITPYVDAVLEENQSTSVPRMVKISMRGVKDVAVNRPNSTESPGAACRRASEMLLARFEPKAASVSASVAYEPVNTKAPFPHLFESVVARNGLVSSKERTKGTGVASVPTLTWLESTPRVATFLGAITEETGRLNWQKLQTDKDRVDQILSVLYELMEPF